MNDKEIFEIAEGFIQAEQFPRYSDPIHDEAVVMARWILDHKTICDYLDCKDKETCSREATITCNPKTKGTIQ